MPASRSLVAIAAAVLLLTGCAAPAAPSASAPPSPGVTPTPTPTPTPASAARIVLGHDGFEIEGSDGGIVFEHEWPDEIAPAVAALTEALDSEPEVTTQAGDGTHIADFDLYSWGGLLLADAVGLEKDRDAYFLPSYMRYLAAETQGVELSTTVGASVGMPRAAAEAISPNQIETRFDGRIRICVDAEDPALLGVVGDEPTDTVELLMDPEGALVSEILAPSQSYSPI